MKFVPANQSDKLLFTPGPLTTSATVKQAMLHDAGSWHSDFNECVRWIREQLLALAEVSTADGWEVRVERPEWMAEAAPPSED